jgi:two-component system alkaline phosphatase synthesis response regulator PhoP
MDSDKGGGRQTVKTVLIVDDDKTFTGLLRTVFELEGYQAIVVTSPDDVVQRAHQVEPALIVMDVHTGNSDTLPVLRELRTNEMLKSVAVLMVSGLDHSTECLAAGADKFMLKPFRPSELLAAAAGLIR